MLNDVFTCASRWCIHIGCHGSTLSVNLVLYKAEAARFGGAKSLRVKVNVRNLDDCPMSYDDRITFSVSSVRPERLCVSHAQCHFSTLLPGMAEIYQRSISESCLFEFLSGWVWPWIGCTVPNS
jgi:hypothetical protein